MYRNIDRECSDKLARIDRGMVGHLGTVRSRNYCYWGHRKYTDCYPDPYKCMARRTMSRLPLKLLAWQSM